MACDRSAAIPKRSTKEWLTAPAGGRPCSAVSVICLRSRSLLRNSTISDPSAPGPIFVAIRFRTASRSVDLPAIDKFPLILLTVLYYIIICVKILVISMNKYLLPNFGQRPGPKDRAPQWGRWHAPACAMLLGPVQDCRAAPALARAPEARLECMEKAARAVSAVTGQQHSRVRFDYSDYSDPFGFLAREGVCSHRRQALPNNRRPSGANPTGVVCATAGRTRRGHAFVRALASFQRRDVGAASRPVSIIAASRTTSRRPL